MLAYILRRIFWFIPVFFVVTALTFWTVRALPGGPFDFAGDKQLPAYVVRNIKRKYGLDKPIWRQYLTYLGDLVRLDFGVSFKYRDRDVSSVLGLKVIQVQQAKTDLVLRRTAEGGLVVVDLGKEYPLVEGKKLELRDGTTVKYASGQVVVERRQEVALKLPVQALALADGGLAVRQDGKMVPLDEGVEVVLADGTVVRREGKEVLVRSQGGRELRLTETSSGLLAIVKSDGGAEKLPQHGRGYKVEEGYYARLAPERADVLLSQLVMQVHLEVVSVEREGAKVDLLAVEDGQGQQVLLEAGVRVELADGTVVTGEAEGAVVRKGDLQVVFAPVKGGKGAIGVQQGEGLKTLGDQGMEVAGLVVSMEGKDVYVMQQVLRVPLVRMLGVVGEDGKVQRLEEGQRVDLADKTVLTNKGGDVTARLGRERLTLGWAKTGELVVILQDGSPSKALSKGSAVDLDDRTKVQMGDGLVIMQRRLDLPLKYTLYPQADGGWAVSSAGADTPQPLRQGKKLELPGDLSVRWKGDSFQGSVRRVLFEGKNGLPISARVGLLALTIALCIGIPLGIIAALRHNTIIDYSATFFAILGVSIPNLVLGPVLIWIFVLILHLLDLNWTGRFSNYILPAFALGIGMSAAIARLTRASLLQVIQEDYIRTARAKGLSARTVVVRHALKNSLIPVVTILGPMFANVVTGTVVIEQIFAIPGMGRHFVMSIGNRDYPIVMATTIIYAVLIVLANLTVDITYGILDPRIRYS